MNFFRRTGQPIERKEKVSSKMSQKGGNSLSALATKSAAESKAEAKASKAKTRASSKSREENDGEGGAQGGNEKIRGESESKLLELLQILVDGVGSKKAADALDALRESLLEDEAERGQAKAKLATLQVENDALGKAVQAQEKRFRDMERSFKTDLGVESKEREAMQKKMADVDKGLGEVKVAVAAGGGGAGGQASEMWKHEIRAEKREREGNVIIRGIPYEQTETPQEAYAKVSAIFDTMGLIEPMRVRFTKRLVNKRKTPVQGAKPPPVLVSFEGAEQKRALFTALPTWGKQQGNDVYKFANDVLPSLRKEHDALEKRAYEMRKDLKGLRTRVILQDVTYALLIKKPGETRFTPEKAAGPDAPT